MPAKEGDGAGATFAEPTFGRPRWRVPIWVALLAGFGGVTAAASLLLVSLRGRGEKTKVGRLV